MCKFPVRCKGINELMYIFPSMQKQVQKIYEIAVNIPSIQRVVVFGSSVTRNCGIGSDLDIAVDAPNIYNDDEFLSLVRPIRKCVDVSLDIVHFNTIKSQLLINEITKNGVEIICRKFV